ncbi:DUF799 family lipoprotein [Nitrospira defluvii]|nr:DUF799 family lipoprotein [Nitrospira defluvii]
MALTTLTYGCAARQISRPPNPSNPIRSIAILPMLNNSDDVEAPTRVREAFYNRIKNFHYDVTPLEETNRILNEQMGITLGRQLDMATAQKLGETLGVDGVFYGYLLNFDEITIGVLNTHKVRMGWKLVDTKTGKITWGKGIAVMRAESIGGFAGMGSNEAEKVGPLPGSADPMAEMPGLEKWVILENKSVGVAEGLVMGLGGKLIGSITGSSLKKEMEQALNRIFSGMPVGPGSSAIAIKE